VASLLRFAILLFGFWQEQAAGARPLPLSSAEISALRTKAEAGDPSAQFALGQAYDYGNRVEQSDKSACLWYRRAAEQGFAPAQNSLGVMYRSGRGVEQSKEQAVQWYRNAAKQKNAKAMFNLGTAYYNGDGTAIDDIAAYAWFLLAKEQGSEPARDAVNRMSDSLLRWQISSAFEAVGDIYERGVDFPQDHHAAIEWYRKAAQLGEAPIRVKLAKYLLDRPEPHDYPEALHWCEEAGKQMYSPGALCAGLLYEKGIGTAPDLQEAVKWFNKSAQLGNAQAMLRLGEMYWSGSGVKQDKVSAYAFVFLASTADLHDALQDKATYEKALSSKELEKARNQATKWVKEHPTLGLKQKTPPSPSQQ
jgi:TPR repeat protein